MGNEIQINSDTRVEIEDISKLGKPYKVLNFFQGDQGIRLGEDELRFVARVIKSKRAKETA